MDSEFTKEQVEFRTRRAKIERLFIFTDKFIVGNGHKKMSKGDKLIHENDIYEVVEVVKNTYHNQEYYFLNNTKNILPF